MGFGSACHFENEIEPRFLAKGSSGIWYRSQSSDQVRTLSSEKAKERKVLSEKNGSPPEGAQHSDSQRKTRDRLARFSAGQFAWQLLGCRPTLSANGR